MKNKFVVVREDNGQQCVKTQRCKNGHWYTVAETYCVPGFGDSKQIAEAIAEALNSLNKI